MKREVSNTLNIGKKSLRSAVIVLTDQGLVTGRRILETFQERRVSASSITAIAFESDTPVEEPELWVHKKCDVSQIIREKYNCYTFERLSEILPDLWRKANLLIFVMATGIVVRQIAPLIQRKDCDPAVLVLDEKGQFVISLLSGHLGGANAWTKAIADQLGAQSVITTATDVHGLIAPDEYARRLGWTVEPISGLKSVNRYLLDNGQLKVWSEIDLSAEHPLKKDKHYYFISEEEKELAQIWITPFRRNLKGKDKVGDKTLNKQEDKPPRLTLVPRTLCIGVGSRRGISKKKVLEAIQTSLIKIKATEQSILGIFSIDLKQNETGIIEAAQELGVPFLSFTASEIQNVVNHQGLSRSEFVKEKIGVDGVCEAASLLGTKQGVIILPKQIQNGVTVAISMERSLS